MLLVIVVVFVSSIGIRYRATKELPPDEPNLSDRGDPSDGTWTTWVRNRWLDLLPPKKMLPSTQPTYVRTWVYSFGMLMIGSLFWIVVSGLILTLKGQEWYHLTEQGRYIRSTHAWATQFFFLFMAVHFLGVLAGSAWRGGRKLVWVTGMLAFLASVGEAFTGFLIQGQCRLPVDRSSSQGRPQRRWCWLSGQHSQLRSDADASHRAVRSNRGRVDRRPYLADSAPWRRSPRPDYQYQGGVGIS